MHKSMLKPDLNEIKDNSIDVTKPEHVEIKFDGRTLWVNVNGICLLRVCRAGKWELDIAPKNGTHNGTD